MKKEKLSMTSDIIVYNDLPFGFTITRGEINNLIQVLLVTVLLINAYRMGMQQQDDVNARIAEIKANCTMYFKDIQPAVPGTFNPSIFNTTTEQAKNGTYATGITMYKIAQANQAGLANQQYADDLKANGPQEARTIKQLEQALKEDYAIKNIWNSSTP